MIWTRCVTLLSARAFTTFTLPKTVIFLKVKLLSRDSISLIFSSKLSSISCGAAERFSCKYVFLLDQAVLILDCLLCERIDIC